MQKLYFYESIVGTYYICRHRQIYISLLGNKLLNSHATTEEAARALATRDHVTLPPGVARESLGIPPELNKWRSCEERLDV